MTVANIFDRITLNALVGAWGASTPINLTTGTVDWIVPAKTGSSLTTGAVRKSTGGSLLTPSVVGSDAGLNQDATSTPNFTWSDGTASTNSLGDHGSSLQTIGNGYRVTCPAPKWPDWRTLRVWILMGNPCQLKFTASMDDTDATTQIDGIGGDPDVGGYNGAYTALGNLAIDVKFASDRAGKTLTLDLLRNNTSMGYYIFAAAALYTGAPTVDAGHGGMRSLFQSAGLQGPLGSR